MKTFILRLLGVAPSFKQLHRRVAIVEAQTEFLLANAPRTLRRKWKRVLTNPHSPFYIWNPSSPYHPSRMHK